jgi:hypothetical protein
MATSKTRKWLDRNIPWARNDILPITAGKAVGNVARFAGETVDAIRAGAGEVARGFYSGLTGDTPAPGEKPAALTPYALNLIQGNKAANTSATPVTPSGALASALATKDRLPEDLPYRLGPLVPGIGLPGPSGPPKPSTPMFPMPEVRTGDVSGFLAEKGLPGQAGMPKLSDFQAQADAYNTAIWDRAKEAEGRTNEIRAMTIGTKEDKRAAQLAPAQAQAAAQKAEAERQNQLAIAQTAAAAEVAKAEAERAA